MISILSFINSAVLVRITLATTVINKIISVIAITTVAAVDNQIFRPNPFAPYLAIRACVRIGCFCRVFCIVRKLFLVTFFSFLALLSFVSFSGSAAFFSPALGIIVFSSSTIIVLLSYVVLARALEFAPFALVFLALAFHPIYKYRYFSDHLLFCHLLT